jgi:intein-encoded DNA endonuclease-like protein
MIYMPSGIKVAISPQARDEIISWYLAGSSARDLARRFGLKCPKSIVKILKDNHVATRDRSQSAKNRSVVFSGQEIEQMLFMNCDPTVSLIDIARQFNRDPKIIRRQLASINAYDPLKYDKFLIGKFDVVSREDQAYWLGMLGADGNVSKKQLSLQLAEKDLSHLLKFKSFMGVNYKISKTTSNIDGKIFVGYRYVVSSANFVRSLNKHGLTPKKSFTLQFAKTIPHDLIRHYIRGLVDGDGSFHINQSNKMSFSLISSLNVCEEVQKYLMDSCRVNKTKLYEMTAKKGEKYYYLTYCGSQQCARIASYLYDGANIFLDRKKSLTDAFRINHAFSTNKNRKNNELL